MVPVVMYLGRRPLMALTADLSISGFFVVTDAPPPVGQLVRFEFPMLDGEPSLTVTGMARHHREATRFSDPGCGVQLYGIGRDLERQWCKYIDMVSRRRTPDTAVAV